MLRCGRRAGQRPGHLGRALSIALRYNRLKLHEVLWGGSVCRPLRPIIPYCQEHGEDGLRALEALRDRWQTGSNEIDPPPGHPDALQRHIVVMTAPIEVRPNRAFGFTAEADVRTDRATAQVAEAVGAGIAEQCDIVITAVSSISSSEGVRCERLLNEVAERYRQQGLHVSWDASAVNWLNAKLSASTSPRYCSPTSPTTGARR